MKKLKVLFFSLLLSLAFVGTTLAHEDVDEVDHEHGVETPVRVLQQQTKEERAEEMEARLEAAEEAREEKTEERETKREELREKLQEVKDERKAKIAAHIDEQLAHINEKSTKAMSNVLSRMVNLLEKLSNRVEKMESNDRDMSATKEAVTVAEVAIVEAQVAVNEQMNKTYLIVFTDDAGLRIGAIAAKTNLRTDLKAVRAILTTTRQTVVDALKSAKGEKPSSESTEGDL